MASTDSFRSCDVIVIGAGPAGCAAATILARLGVRIALIDDGRRTSWPGETLPGGSTGVMEDVFGSEVLALHRRAFAVQAAWETEELQVTDALMNPLGEGWLLDRRAFDGQARAAASLAGALVVTGHAEVDRDADGMWQVRVDDERLHAPLVVDATGRPAVIARRARARAKHASRLLACITTIDEPGDRVQATTIESVPEGWWYSTPTPNGGRVLALVSDAALVPRGDARAAWWVSSLTDTRHIRALLPEHRTIDTELVSGLHVGQAGTGWLDDPYGPGWVAVGDAAAHFDPLSSQGLLTGILMGARAGQAIVDDSLEDWSVDYRMIVDEHRVLADHYYGLVDRWPQSRFWSARVNAE